MTVSMSDHDYGLLVQAVGWIEHHAGLDAPEYPHLTALSSVVDCIGKRREPAIAHERQPDSPGTRMVVYLIGARGGDDPELASSSGQADLAPNGNPLMVEPSFETPCPDCRTPVTFPDLPGEASCPACDLRLHVTDIKHVGRCPDAGAIQGQRS